MSWNNGAGGEPDGGGNDGKMERWRGGHEIGRDPVRTERDRERVKREEGRMERDCGVLGTFRWMDTRG